MININDNDNDMNESDYSNGNCADDGNISNNSDSNHTIIK